MDKTPTLLGFLIDLSVWPLNQLKMACGRVFLFVIIFKNLNDKFIYALIL